MALLGFEIVIDPCSCFILFLPFFNRAEKILYETIDFYISVSAQTFGINSSF